MAAHTRSRILDAALDALREGESVTLDSASRRAGMTKPGLMYHFPTKEDLMLGLVDHVAQAWESDLRARAGKAPADASPAERIRAYVDYALAGEFDGSDLVILSDPRLRVPLSERWAELMTPWIELPDSLPTAARGRLTAVRLLADGVWFAGSTAVFVPTPDDLAAVRVIAYDLLKD